MGIMGSRVRFSFVALCLIPLLFLPDANLYACTCAPPDPPEAAFQKADAVFLGEVTAVELVQGESDFLAQNKVTFQILKAFKGVQGTHAEVLTPRSNVSCGYPFQKKEVFLIYAFRESEKGLDTTLCSRTQLRSEATEDLQYLATLPSR